MPHITIGIQILHIQFDDIGSLHRLTGLERTLNDPTSLQIPNPDPVKSLTFTRFYKLIFHDRTRVSINDDF